MEKRRVLHSDAPLPTLSVERRSAPPPLLQVVENLKAEIEDLEERLERALDGGYGKTVEMAQVLERKRADLAVARSYAPTA